ncbi:hypothetical protein ig2599ANME_2296 [groundwater metagenome]
MAGLVLEVSPTTIPADGISISSVVIKVKDDKGNFITFLGEWAVEMTTTLGTLHSEKKWFKWARGDSNSGSPLCKSDVIAD